MLRFMLWHTLVSTFFSHKLCCNDQPSPFCTRVSVSPPQLPKRGIATSHVSAFVVMRHLLNSYQYSNQQHMRGLVSNTVAHTVSYSFSNHCPSHRIVRRCISGLHAFVFAIPSASLTLLPLTGDLLSVLHCPKRMKCPHNTWSNLCYCTFHITCVGA